MLQAPQWNQGESLMGETGKSREQKYGNSENDLKLYLDTNFTLFYIKFYPANGKFRLLLLF